MMKIILTFIIVILFLNGCTAIKMAEDTAIRPEGTDKTMTYGTWVAMGDCAFGDPAESAIVGLGEALLGSAISSGVNTLGTNLTAAGTDKSINDFATRRIRVNAKTFGPCMQIVRGWFYEDPSDLSKSSNHKAPWFSAKFIAAEQDSILWSNGLWLAAEPDLLFEGTFQKTSIDSNNIALYPNFVMMSKPLFTRSFNANKERDIKIHFVIGENATAIEKNTGPGAMIDIGKLKIGESKRYLAFQKDIEYANTRMTDSVEVRPGNYYPLSSSQPITLALGEEFQDKVLVVSVTESQDGSAAAKFLGEVITGSQASITTNLQDLVLPTNRAKAKATEENAEDKALTTYFSALGTALTNLETCKSDGSTTNAVKARNAMISLNTAARGVNKKEPFSMGDILSIVLIGDTAVADAAAECAELLSKISE